MRKTPLKRSTKPLKRSPLARVSPKQRSKLQEYHTVRKAYLQQHPTCQICNSKQATQIHHKAGRGINLSNPELFLATCGKCHRKVHDRPQWARDHGYLI